MNERRKTRYHRLPAILLIALAGVPLAVGQEEVKVEDGVVVIFRDFGVDMPALSPNGQSLAVCGNEQLRFINPRTGQRITQFPKAPDSSRRAAWTPDGRAVVTIGDKIVFWNAKGERFREFEAAAFASPDRVLYFTAFAVHPDGKRIALGFQSGDVVVAGIADRRPLRKLSGGHREIVSDLVWNGDTLYSSGGYGDGNVCVWNASTGEQRMVIAADDREVRSMALHPKGKWLLTLGNRNEVVLWNPEPGQAVQRFPTAANLQNAGMQPGSVGFLADGQVVAATQGKNIGLWKISGEPIRTLAGHNEVVRKIDISQDGELLVSAGGNTMRIWKVKDVLQGVKPSAPGKTTATPAVKPAQTRAKPAALVLNDLKKWEIVRGDWKQANGRIIGAGDSRIDFSQTYPNDFTFRCKLLVNGPTNPRIRFGSFHFGYEGRNPQFFLHGPKASGQPMPFEYGKVYAIQVRVQGSQATLWIDGKEIARSNPAAKEDRFISLEGGGRQSQSSAEFFEMELVPASSGGGASVGDRGN